MDCREIQPNISPYLDGELTTEESQIVQSHLNECAACRQKYDELAALAAAVKQLGNQVLPVPAGFKDAVLKQIREDCQPVTVWGRVHNITGKWRSAAAAAAAVLLITMTGLGIHFIPVSQVAHNDTPNDQKTIVADKGDTIKRDSNSSNTSNTDSSFSNPASNSDPTETGNNNIDNGAAEDPLNENQPFNESENHFGVLLNKEQVIKTTMLTVKTADSAAALTQARNIALAAGAATESLGQQVSENGLCSVLKITATKSSSDGLLKSLKGLGTVTGQEVDEKDMTSHFVQNVDKYQALVAELEAVNNSDQKAQLNQQIKKLEEEINSLKTSTEKETIVLRLEN